jgi:branched-chain amino acid transport system ATP-binding protein
MGSPHGGIGALAGGERPDKARSLPSSRPVVKLDSVDAGYNGRAVVRDLSLEVRPGEVVALLGSNGAGKTTVLRSIAGELPLVGGDVWLHGRRATEPVHRRAKRGLRFVTEERSVFMSMTVADNLRLLHGDITDCLQLFPELAPLVDRKAGLLSGGEQQMLTLARAIVGDVSLILADELSLGLAPLVVARLLEALRAAADRGVAVILVEQQVRQALRVADRGVVLRRGEVVMEGPSSELEARIEEIETAYLAGAASTGGADGAHD